MFFYLGVRLFYLVSGRSHRFAVDDGDVSIAYSWMVLVADSCMSAMGLYLHQKFWKQNVRFRPLTDLEIRKMTDVRYRNCLPNVML